MISYKSVSVQGLNVFYREAGRADAPVLVLLHGFPSSSHMFRDLIPQLADRFHVIAPDLIGFGYSDRPAADAFDYTFDRLSRVAEELLFDGLGLKRFSVYVQDYGAPIGFRIAARRPEAIEALIVQNGNAYEEGLSDAWAPIRAVWQRRTPSTEKAVKMLLTAETTRFQYTHGVADVTHVSPDSYTFDQLFLDRANNDAVQIALFADYKANLAEYPTWQTYFRAHRPPTLIVWGANDPFFTLAGAEAFRRDLPDAQIHLLDSGHFALEDNGHVIAEHIRRFLLRSRRDREKKGVTAVLVHGAWADGSSWSKVATELYGRGYDVVAAQLPLTSLSDDTAALKRLLARIDQPIVLAGHSYGGAVITAAAVGQAQVRGLVYVAGMAPDTGETVGELFYRTPIAEDTLQIAPDDHGFVWLDADSMTRVMAPDAGADESLAMYVSQKPVHLECMGQPMPKPAWREHSSRYIVCAQDRVLSPETQRFMAHRAGADVVELPVDHCPLFTNAVAIADVVERAAVADVLLG